jgi:myxalamid-type polyketide synthase MxaE and MxaD
VNRSRQEIQDWIVSRVSALTGVPAREIEVDKPLLRCGLDSVAVVALAADLETWLGYRFHENPLDEHPTIEALARFLAEQVADNARKE